MSKSLLAGLLLSVAFAPQAFAGFEFVAPVAPIASSQQAPQAAEAAEATKTIIKNDSQPLPPITSGTLAAPKLQPLMKPVTTTTPVPVVKATESDALLLSDEVLAQPPKMAPTAPTMVPAATAPKARSLPITLPKAAPAPQIAPNIVSAGQKLAPVVADMKPAAATAPLTPTTYAVAQGFGKQVPLALALRQIVPPEFRFSFGSGVNAGQLVDWQGGAPWDQVVNNLAHQQGLMVRIASQVVLIENNPNATTPASKLTAMPTSLVPSLPPLSANNAAPQTSKKAPAFAGDNPLVIALSDVLPTTTTADMSLNQPRPSFEAPPRSAMAAAPLQNIQNNNSPKAQALPTSLVPTPPTPAVLAPKTPAPQPMLAAAAAEPSLAPITTPTPPKTTAQTTAQIKSLPATLPPLPKDRGSIDVAPTEKLVAPPAQKTTDNLNNKQLVMQPAAQTAPTPEASAKTATAPKPLPPIMPAPIDSKEKASTASTPKIVQPLLPPIAPDAAETIKPQPAIKAVDATNGLPQTWVAEKGQTLRQAFAAWASQASITLIWSAAYDYPLQTDVAINGTFPDAVRTMLDGFANAQPRPIGRLHKNGATGNAVLVVETKQATE